MDVNPAMTFDGGLFKAPETDLELLLANIWSELLSIDRVGITDRFFDLGGHSLKAIQLVNQIYKTT
ncbi:phosphopantetheine-binding protein, partial [Stenotrophomonas maltophilia group sp. RNC7]|uniref:phosphopantetheine-binding protein n=1 Tax=Stenotrophomonas maltophilia group sp. RNC7 TaxID=3071467 RepID=UPI0027E0FC24